MSKSAGVYLDAEKEGRKESQTSQDDIAKFE